MVNRKKKKTILPLKFLSDTVCNPLRLTVACAWLESCLGCCNVASHLVSRCEFQVRGPVSVSFPVIGRGALVFFLSRGKRNCRHPICAPRKGKGAAGLARVEAGSRQVRSTYTPTTCHRHLPTSSAGVSTVFDLHLDGRSELVE